jgi:hypothetical protein
MTSVENQVGKLARGRVASHLLNPLEKQRRDRLASRQPHSKIVTGDFNPYQPFLLELDNDHGSIYPFVLNTGKISVTLRVELK